MTTSATPPTPTPTISQVAEDVSALETEVKSDFASLTTDTKNLITQALAAAKAEGSAIFAAFHATVTTK